MFCPPKIIYLFSKFCKNQWVASAASLMFYPNIASAAHVSHAPPDCQAALGPSNCFKSHSANCFATHSASAPSLLSALKPSEYFLLAVGHVTEHLIIVTNLQNYLLLI